MARHREVVCRFYCRHVTKKPPYESTFASGEGEARPQDVSLHAVEAPNRPESEDHAFWKATPHGEVELSIENPAAEDFFEPGAKYEVTFRKVEDGES